MQVHVTRPHPCSYLPGRMARTLFVAPGEPTGPAIYSQLVRLGFRRSGMFPYRPNCDQCHACVPVRVPVEEFHPSRSQKRAAAAHETLQTTALQLQFLEEHYALYSRYQAGRHAGGAMDPVNRAQYSSFLVESPVETWLVEFRDQGKLVMVSVIDELTDGLSSVYTFYDPDIHGASFGTYSILWQIAQCRRIGAPFLYLGYWIKESRKMSYKARFQPIEGFLDGSWRRLQADEIGDSG